MVVIIKPIRICVTFD